MNSCADYSNEVSSSAWEMQRITELTFYLNGTFHSVRNWSLSSSIGCLEYKIDNFFLTTCDEACPEVVFECEWKATYFKFIDSQTHFRTVLACQSEFNHQRPDVECTFPVKTSTWWLRPSMYSMGHFFGSWSFMILHWLYCIHNQ